MKQFMNKKQLGVTLILIGLMIVLFAAQKGFDDRIKLAALMNSNIADFKQYTIDGTNYSYGLPNDWITEEKNYPGNYIIYNSSFKDKELGLIGYVQLINSKSKVRELVSSDSKKLKQDKVREYKSKKIELNGKEGYLVSYKEKLNEGKLLNYNIYYLNVDNDKNIKVCFSVGQEKYRENLTTIFEAIVETVKTNK